MSVNPDKISILKSVNLFTEIPEEDLAQAAELLGEEQFRAVEVIITKGAEGDCLYIIAEGRVRVHDGDMTLNYLGRRDVFGEMAALDPEPRSATVTADEDTRLFRLERSALYDLMARQPQVAQGIIQILSQRLRARVRDMAEDFEYMRQFARVTSAAVAVEGGAVMPSGSSPALVHRSSAYWSIASGPLRSMVRDVSALDIACAGA